MVQFLLIVGTRLIPLALASLLVVFIGMEGFGKLRGTLSSAMLYFGVFFAGVVPALVFSNRESAPKTQGGWGYLTLLWCLALSCAAVSSLFLPQYLLLACCLLYTASNSVSEAAAVVSGRPISSLGFKIMAPSSLYLIYFFSSDFGYLAPLIPALLAVTLVIAFRGYFKAATWPLVLGVPRISIWLPHQWNFFAGPAVLVFYANLIPSSLSLLGDNEAAGFAALSIAFSTLFSFAPAQLVRANLARLVETSGYLNESIMADLRWYRLGSTFIVSLTVTVYASLKISEVELELGSIALSDFGWVPFVYLLYPAISNIIGPRETILTQLGYAQIVRRNAFACCALFVISVGLVCLLSMPDYWGVMFAICYVVCRTLEDLLHSLCLISKCDIQSRQLNLFKTS